MVDSLAALRRIIGGADPHRSLVCFWMHRCRGLTEAEIGEAVGLTQPGVHYHRNRVRQALVEAQIPEQTAVDLIESAA